MQVLMLVRVAPGAEPPPGEVDDIDAWLASTGGRRLLGEMLVGPGDAVTVRAGASPIVSDGPFAEVVEQIAGFDLLEVDSRAEAVAIAGAHPVASFGALELRELWPFDEDAPDAAPALDPARPAWLLLMASPTHPTETDHRPPADWYAEVTERAATSVLGSELRPADEAVVVRRSAGRVHAEPGPATGSGAQVVGFDLLQADDADAAVALAQRHPAARSGGAIEVRQLWTEH